MNNYQSRFNLDLPSYDSYNLFLATDEHITRPKIVEQNSSHYYPSEASVVMLDDFGDRIVEGGCLRASYFRITNTVKAMPHNARSEYIFMLGKMIEEKLIGYWKEMGIWVGNNIKWYDQEHNISGELDAVLSEPPNGIQYVLEAKSCYGYMAEKEIFGNKSQQGFPKINHLLQTLTYLYYFRDKYPYARLAYFARDSVKRRTFKIELHQEGELTYPKVEGTIYRKFTVQDIYARYKQLDDYIKSGTLPPNDYELCYSPEKIEDYYKKGKIAKTKYEKWKKSRTKKEIIGNWNCGYCNWKSICYGNHSDFLDLETSDSE